jgi:DNA-damage-inducible protein D
VKDLTPSVSPFDAMKRTRSDDSEFWSARQLMPDLGYTDWRNFVSSIDRAKAAATNQGLNVSDLFVDATEKTAGRPREDFELARFACYLVAMNGDPRKREVAAAQAYFAIQTRMAETATPARELTFEEMMLEVMGTLQSRVDDQRHQLAAVAPKVEAYDALMDAAGVYSMQATAKALALGPNVMYRKLRDLGIILHGSNLPAQKYAHHFDVKLGSYRNKRGETIPTATTMVRPSGLDFLRRKLTKATEEAAGSLAMSGGAADGD